MSYEIPEHYESQIKKVAQNQHVSEVQAVELIMQAGLKQVVADTKEETRTNYVSLFGSAPGPGTFKTREEVDRYVEELRNAW